MFEYAIIRYNVELALADEPRPVGASKLVLLSSDDPDATFRLDDPTADPIPALSTFQACAEPGGLIDRILLTTAGTGTATDEVVFLAIFKGDANLYAAP